MCFYGLTNRRESVPPIYQLCIRQLTSQPTGVPLSPVFLVQGFGTFCQVDNCQSYT